MLSRWQGGRRRFEALRRLRGQPPYLLENRNNQLLRSDVERAIFLPLRSRSPIQPMNFQTSATPMASTSIPQDDAARIIRNMVANIRGGNANNANNGNNNGDDGTRNETAANNPAQQPQRPRINVSTFFMELTYSAAESSCTFRQFRSAAEAQRRRMEIHATNTMNLIKYYCPTKLHKFSQFRCCTRTQRLDFFSFKNFQSDFGNLLDTLDPTQHKCNTKVLVVVRESNCVGSKWGNPFTSCLMSYLCKKHLNPTCLTFQSDSPLNVLIEHLCNDHAFPKKASVHDLEFKKRAKAFLLLSTLAKLLEDWKTSLLVLDSYLWKFVDVKSVLLFARKFQIKVFDVNPADGCAMGGASNKQRKVKARQVGREIRKAVVELNVAQVKKHLEKSEWAFQPRDGLALSCTKDLNSNLLNEDCRKLVLSLHEHMSQSFLKQEEHPKRCGSGQDISSQLRSNAQLSLLEGEILTEIKQTDAFKYSSHRVVPKSGGRIGIIPDKTRLNGSRPKTGYSSIPDDELSFKDQEKVSQLLFHELGERWRVHGPQRFISKGEGSGDAGPYCDPLLDSEEQLLISVVQEVANFEMLKEMRTVLKDSKKDLEGRLYGYNPEFSNLIASAEEFLHGKACCMDPCRDEMEFYKNPVSLVYSDAEVKYMKSKPPVLMQVVGTDEMPNQFIKLAIEESTKLFWEAILHTTCASRHIPSSKRNKTKAVVIIEDNNEALELLTVALWFFEKTPLATFQSKYCHCTADFLLGVDAVRFYFKNYPVYSTKKEDEHIFERWLGVGLNGILRSYQSKIVLIELPRPGTNLQKTTNILYNRMKIEEKLHNIKTFKIGKPSRKEDTFSTVENVLNEIQKTLEPRDKLLFRKARRMYLDLKLYKQIELKSRSDLKALRDWGLPEPDNENSLWERL